MEIVTSKNKKKSRIPYNINYLMRIKATFDYSSEEPEEISFLEGDIIEVLEEDSSGWWTGKVNGKEGFFPTTFVDVTPLDDEPDNQYEQDNLNAMPKGGNSNQVVDPLAELKAKLKTRENNSGSEAAAAPATQARPQSRPPASLPPSIPQQNIVCASFDYVAEADTEISFKEGDNIVVTQKDESGWWKGYISGGSREEGWFPNTFIKLEESPVRKNSRPPTSLPPSIPQQEPKQEPKQESTFADTKVSERARLDIPRRINSPGRSNPSPRKSSKEILVKEAVKEVPVKEIKQEPPTEPKPILAAPKVALRKVVPKVSSATTIVKEKPPDGSNAQDFKASSLKSRFEQASSNDPPQRNFSTQPKIPVKRDVPVRTSSNPEPKQEPIAVLPKKQPQPQPEVVQKPIPSTVKVDTPKKNNSNSSGWDFGELVSIWKKLNTSKGKNCTLNSYLESKKSNIEGFSVCSISGENMVEQNDEIYFTLQGAVWPFVTQSCKDSQKFNEPAIKGSCMYDTSFEDSNNTQTCSGIISLIDQIINEKNEQNLLSETLQIISDLSDSHAGCSLPAYLSAKKKSNLETAIACIHATKKQTNSSPNEILDFYFQLNSIELSLKSASVLAATLANQGVNPITNKKCLSLDNFNNLLNIGSNNPYSNNSVCLFNGSSGVILVVIPNTIGLAVYSPKINSNFISSKGDEFINEILKKFG